MPLLTPLLLDRYAAADARTRFEPFFYHLTPGGVPIAGANWNLNGNYIAQTDHALYIPPGRDLYLTSLTATVRDTAGNLRPDRWGTAILTTGWQVDLVTDWNKPEQVVSSLNPGITYTQWAALAAVATTVSKEMDGAGDDFWMLTMVFGGVELPFLPVLRGGRDTLRARIGPLDNLTGNNECRWVARGLLA